MGPRPSWFGLTLLLCADAASCSPYAWPGRSRQPSHLLWLYGESAFVYLIYCLLALDRRLHARKPLRLYRR